MLKFIQDITNKLLEYIKDDPVRPEISTEFRVSDGRAVAALVDEQENPEAIVCVSFHDFIPESVEDLQKTVDNPTVCVAYSIWSYRPGAGRELIMSVIKSVREQHPSVSRIVTLSPKTPLAAKFHVSNGAFVLNENTDTINYEYPDKLWS